MVFLDNASTTQVDSKVLEIINKYNYDNFYNPSALYGDAFSVSKDINNARKNIIKRLGGRATDNLIFTSCATESNNMVLRACIKKNMKAIVSMGEHPSVYKTALDMANNGYNIDFVGLVKDGQVDEVQFKKMMTPDVGFVSIMHVNNETGAINNIQQLVKIAKSINPKCIFHCDGVQAFCKINVNVTQLGVDFYTISGHKIHAPKGIGALYVKDSKFVKPLLFGGGQEGELRSGTENVSGIMALDKASEISFNSINDNFEKMKKLKGLLVEKVEGAYIISDDKCSPYITMLACTGVRAETILHMLESKGFLVGNGSACSSKKRENRNLTSMGYRDELIDGTIRVSFSHNTREQDVIDFTASLNEVIKEYNKKVN